MSLNHTVNYREYFYLFFSCELALLTHYIINILKPNSKTGLGGGTIKIKNTCETDREITLCLPTSKDLSFRVIIMLYVASIFHIEMFSYREIYKISHSLQHLITAKSSNILLNVIDIIILISSAYFLVSVFLGLVSTVYYVTVVCLCRYIYLKNTGRRDSLLRSLSKTAYYFIGSLAPSTLTNYFPTSTNCICQKFIFNKRAIIHKSKDQIDKTIKALLELMEKNYFNTIWLRCVLFVMMIPGDDKGIPTILIILVNYLIATALYWTPERTIFKKLANFKRNDLSSNCLISGRS